MEPPPDQNKPIKHNDHNLDAPPIVGRREFAQEVINELNQVPRAHVVPVELPFHSDPRPQNFPKAPSRTIGTNPFPPVEEHNWPRVHPPAPEPHTTSVTHPGSYRLMTATGTWPVPDPRVNLGPNPSRLTTSTSTASIDIDTPRPPHEISIRVKSADMPSVVLRHIRTGQPIGEFVAELARLTSIPATRLKILKGFPPKRVALDRSLTVESLGIRSQESIIVERGSPTKDACTGTGNCMVYACTKNCQQFDQGCNRVRMADRHSNFFENAGTNTDTVKPDGLGPIWTVGTQATEEAIATDTIQPEPEPLPLPEYPTNWARTTLSDDDLLNSNGIILRRIVPADNSCLFSSFRYALDGLLGDPHGYLVPESTLYLREIVAGRVEAEPERYNEAFLGRPNHEYVRWITRLDSWGGGIELSILAEFHEVEIAVVSTQTCTCNVFGEGQNYTRRIYLIYDGIHYDPLYMECYTTARIITRFKPDDSDAYTQAMQMAVECNLKHEFTDLKNFHIQCEKCKVKFTGEDEASKHAGLTGHRKFKEITPIRK